MNYSVNEKGYYGEFGGSYVPEILRENVENLSQVYLQEMNTEAFKQEFAELLRDYVGRPSPLYYAKRLSEHYQTRIYLKREDLNHTGAHKINNTVGQILLAKKMGKRRIIAETGAGQHGVATATVCALMGLSCVVYMGALDVERQHLNVEKMRMLGAEVIAVQSGNQTLKDAVNEALNDWCANPEETFYIIGSAVGPHPYPDMVTRLQSVISEEIQKQLLEKEGRDFPDYLIACVGGGSNAAGTFYYYLDRPETRLIAAEATGKGLYSGFTAATMQSGTSGVLHGARTLVMQDEQGEVLEPYSISAGLDYPGVGPLHAHLAQTKRMDVVGVTDEDALRAAYLLTRLEGIIPALESSHALAVLEKKTFKKEDVVVITLSGRGDKDMDTYLSRKELIDPLIM